MAKPKVMLSSTCFDLSQIRDNLETSINSLGYDTIRSEKGEIGYGITSTLKSDCYLAAQQCDILVGIIGGTYGNPDKPGCPDSISMTEMKTALQYKKQMYLFVDKKVSTECSTYTKNKGKDCASSIEYSFVNDPRIFDFILEMRTHESDSVIIFEFETSADIYDILKKQWASLFQSYLSQKERDLQSSAYTKINESAESLSNSLSIFKNYLDDFSEKTNNFLENQTLGKIFSNPIIFNFNTKIIKTSCILYFKGVDELNSLMELLDYSSQTSDDDNLIYTKEDESEIHKIIFCSDIFVNGTLIYPKGTNKECEKYILSEHIPKDNNVDFDLDDPDLPF